MLVTTSNIEAIISALSKEDELAIDTETTGLGEKDLPFGASIACGTASYWFREDTTPSMWELIATLRPTYWILQNAKFDIRMLERKGVYLLRHSSAVDITSEARLVRNDHLKYNLDGQAKRELGKLKETAVAAEIKKYNLKETRKNFFGEIEIVPRYDWVDPVIMARYAAQDARLTYDLHCKYSEILAGKCDELQEQESALINICHKMERRGLLVDKSYTLAGYHNETFRKDLMLLDYKAITNHTFVNSATAIGKHLSMELPKTEKGNPSLTDDVIDTLVSDNERDNRILELVRGIRRFDKRISTYYKAYLNAMGEDNIIHPTMWIAGTRTGRFSYSDPNFQNMPKEEKSTDEYVIRGCIKPRDGRIFVSLDYSQMEYKLCVAYANQTDVIKKIMQGADFHQATADLVGISRTQAKTLNFAVLYGAGEDKIASMLGCSVPDARILKTKYFLGLPKVERLIDSIISTGRSRGYVTNWMGRNLYADKEFCYALPNHLIQSGGADVVKKAMVQIDKEFPDILMVLQVHDQLVFELTEDELKHVPRIKEIMETVFPPMNDVSLTVDIKYSRENLAERGMKDIGELYANRHATV